MTSPSMRSPRLGVSYSEAITSAYAIAPEDEVILDTLELQHPTFLDDEGNPDPQRVVNDHTALTAILETGDTVTFAPCYFKFTRPTEDGSTSLPEVDIVIDNVAKILLPYIQKAVSSISPVTLIWRPYLASDLTGPHMLPVLKLTLRGIGTDLNTITAKAGFTNLSNRRYPGNEYQSNKFPGLTVR